MELPAGITIEEIEAIVEQYDIFKKEESEETLLDSHLWSVDDTYDGRPYGDCFVDRYITIGNAEYCITTCYEEDNYGETYISDYVTVIFDSQYREDYDIITLKDMIKEYGGKSNDKP